MLSKETKEKVDRVVSELCDFVFVETETAKGYVVDHVKLLTDLLQAVAAANGNTSAHVTITPTVNVTTNDDVEEIINSIEQRLQRECAGVTAKGANA